MNLGRAALIHLRRYVRCVAIAPIGLFGFATAAGALPDTAPATAHESTIAVPTWLWGVWTRDWIQVGKRRTYTVDVHYLQTPTYFSDVRIPRDRPRFAGAVATWHHDMQYQPLAPRKIGDEQWTIPVNTLSRREVKAMFGGEGTP